MGEPSLAIVTGAAVRVGKAIALALASRGFAIGLHFHASEQAAHRTAAEIEALGVPCVLLPADLRDPEEIAALFERVERLPYRLEVLVNSAAVMPEGEIEIATLTDWDQTFDLNLRAPWLCAQAAARLMNAEGGAIVNITDSGTQKAWLKHPLYQVSKIGLEALTRSLARALAPRIRVNAVAPGFIQVDAEPAGGPGWQSLVEKVPLKRPGSAQAVAETVCFLVANAYVTGEIVTVDGGAHLT